MKKKAFEMKFVPLKRPVLFKTKISKITNKSENPDKNLISTSFLTKQRTE